MYYLQPFLHLLFRHIKTLKKLTFFQLLKSRTFILTFDDILSVQRKFILSHQSNFKLLSYFQNLILILFSKFNCWFVFLKTFFIFLFLIFCWFILKFVIFMLYAKQSCHKIKVLLFIFLIKNRFYFFNTFIQKPSWFFI